MTSSGHQAKPGIQTGAGRTEGKEDDLLKQLLREPVSTCVIRIRSKADNYLELLCDLDRAIEAHDYEVVCMGSRDTFSIAEVESAEAFATYIQFNFPSALSLLEDIEEKIRIQAEGACSIDTLVETSRYRLLLVEPCNFSLR